MNEQELNNKWYATGGETIESLEREQEQDALNEFMEELKELGVIK